MKKIDRAMEILEEKRKITVDVSGIIQEVEHEKHDREYIIEEYCPEHFELRDSEFCCTDYECVQCWNEEENE